MVMRKSSVEYEVPSGTVRVRAASSSSGAACTSQVILVSIPPKTSLPESPLGWHVSLWTSSAGAGTAPIATPGKTQQRDPVSIRKTAHRAP